MGLGKTLSMIALIVRQKELNQFSCVTLVVCPKVVVGKRKSSATRFFLSGFSMNSKNLPSQVLRVKTFH
jgi:hypothetical protein